MVHNERILNTLTTPKNNKYPTKVSSNQMVYAII